jgi:hypothetical protein
LKLATISAAVLLVATAACGGDDDELTKAEFVRQANAICKAGNEQLDAAVDETFMGNQRPSNAQLEEFATETVIPNIQRQIDDLRALEAPSEDEEQVEEILDSAQGEVDRLENEPIGLFTDETSFVETNKLSRAYGIDRCADDS